MIAAQLVSELERRFGTTIDLSTLLIAPTVELLALRLGGKPSDVSSIVPLRASGGKIPLFCFHGGGGHLLEYHEMANTMPDDQPVYGLRAPDLDGAQQLKTVEELAENYVREIRGFKRTDLIVCVDCRLAGCWPMRWRRSLPSKGKKSGFLHCSTQAIPPIIAICHLRDP